MRRLRLARLDALPSRLPREILGRNLAVAVHEHEERLALLVMHRQRLDDLVLGDAGVFIQKFFYFLSPRG